MILLVPTGGWAGALYRGMSRSLHVYGALALFNDTVTGDRRFQYDFTLPANSYAPVNLVLIPLKR